VACVLSQTTFRLDYPDCGIAAAADRDVDLNVPYFLREDDRAGVPDLPLF
jgi:hypothetical protein